MLLELKLILRKKEKKKKLQMKNKLELQMELELWKSNKMLCHLDRVMEAWRLKDRYDTMTEDRLVYTALYS